MVRITRLSVLLIGAVLAVGCASGPDVPASPDTVAGSGPAATADASPDPQDPDRPGVALPARIAFADSDGTVRGPAVSDFSDDPDAGEEVRHVLDVHRAEPFLVVARWDPPVSEREGRTDIDDSAVFGLGDSYRYTDADGIDRVGGIGIELDQEETVAWVNLPVGEHEIFVIGPDHVLSLEEAIPIEDPSDLIGTSTVTFNGQVVGGYEFRADRTMSLIVDEEDWPGRYELRRPGVGVVGMRVQDGPDVADSVEVEVGAVWRAGTRWIGWDFQGYSFDHMVTLFPYDS
jgi:hypothetical protein